MSSGFFLQSTVYRGPWFQPLIINRSIAHFRRVICQNSFFPRISRATILGHVWFPKYHYLGNQDHPGNDTYLKNTDFLSIVTRNMAYKHFLNSSHTFKLKYLKKTLFLFVHTYVGRSVIFNKKMGSSKNQFLIFQVLLLESANYFRE